MATFNFTVDTHPMADKLHNVSRHVNGTTGAVVAMQTTVIAAEKKAADHICNNVNKGFYSLIRSQISQKMAKLQSDVDSHVMQLVQQKQALLSMKTRMQRDYNMISSRYIKLFNGLNINLKNRIFELDKPTINFANREVEKLTNRTKYLTATTPIAQLESISMSQNILASNVKQKGLNVINSMKSFIHEMNVQKILTDQILIENSMDTNQGIAYIPIIVYECNRDNTSNLSIDIELSENDLSSIAKSSIKNHAYSQFQNLNWSENSTNQEINSAFSKFVSASSKSSRVNDMAIKLFQASNYQSI